LLLTDVGTGSILSNFPLDEEFI